MSKKYENIDALFKAELGGSAVKAPAHVKANVDKALGFGSGKKLAWIILPLLIVLVASPFIYNSFQPEDLAQSSMREHLSTTPPNNAASSSSRDHSNNEAPSQENNLEKNASYLNAEVTADPSDNFSTSTNYKVDKNSTINSSSSNASNNLSINSTSTSKTGITGAGTGNPNLNIIEKKNKDPQVNVSVTDPKTAITPENKNNVTKPTLDTTLTQVKEKPNGNLIDTTSANQSNTLALKDPETKHPEIKNLEDKSSLVSVTDKDTAENVDLTIKQESDTTATDLALVDSTNNDVPAEINMPAEPYKPWLLSLTTGINFKNSAIVAANPSDSAAYSNTIIDKIGHSASFGAQYRLQNSLTFGAGLGYSTQIENYNFYKSEITSDSALTYVYFQDSIPDSMGWIYFQDSTEEYTYTSSENEVYNANGKNVSTYLHIPISLGTQLRFNKVFIDLFAQGRFNLLLISKSTYVENNQLVTTNLAAIKRSYFDLVLGTNIHYNIFNNLYLTGTVRYRPPFNNPYYVNGMTNRFSNLHLGIGVSLNL